MLRKLYRCTSCSQEYVHLLKTVYLCPECKGVLLWTGKRVEIKAKWEGGKNGKNNKQKGSF